MSTATDYAHAFDVLVQGHKAVPNTSFIACQSGKLQYLADGAFFQVQNEHTAKLPDFFMQAPYAEALVDWLDSLPSGETEITFSKGKLSLKVATDTSEFVAGVYSNDPMYDGVDEIVLTPLLTNQYYFTLTAEDLYWLIERMRVICVEGSFNGLRHKAVLEVVNGKASFAATQYGLGLTVSSVIPTSEQALPEQWINTYSLKGLLESFAWKNMEETVKFSFTDNTNKQKSPLLVESGDGVKVVLAPYWN